MSMLINIVDQVGEPAALEQLAEECCELAQAALKLARCERGENPTPKDEESCKQDVLSEFADVLACTSVLRELDWFDPNIISGNKLHKLERWLERLEGE